MDCKIRRYFRHGTLVQLRVFEAVVRLNSFTRAGEELHMAQPTVSVHMKKLAETIGTPLIAQNGKRIHLTAAGEKVHAACLRVFETICDLEAALNDASGVAACKVLAAAPGSATPRSRRASCFRGACRRSDSSRLKT